MNIRSVAINYCRRIIYFMGFVSLTISSNPCALFLPFLKTTLLSCSPMGTCINYLQGKTWINSPLSLLLQHAEHKNETHPPQMKTTEHPQCFLHPPAPHGYGIASVAPRFGTLQLLTSQNLTQKWPPAPPGISWRATSNPGLTKGTEICPELQSPQSFQS